MVSVLKERLEDTRKELQLQEAGKDETHCQLNLAMEELDAVKESRDYDRRKMDNVRPPCFTIQTLNFETSHLSSVERPSIV